MANFLGFQPQPTREAMAEMPDLDFERLTGFWAREEWGPKAKVEVSTPGSDQGVDVLVTIGSVVPVVYVIQCKRYKIGINIGIGPVNSLVGATVAKNSNHGIFITSSKFTPAAVNQAKNINDSTNPVKLQLIDGDQFWEKIHSMSKYRALLNENTSSSSSSSTSPSLPTSSNSTETIEVGVSFETWYATVEESTSESDATDNKDDKTSTVYEKPTWFEEDIERWRNFLKPANDDEEETQNYTRTFHFYFLKFFIFFFITNPIFNAFLL